MWKGRKGNKGKNTGWNNGQAQSGPVRLTKDRELRREHVEDSDESIVFTRSDPVRPRGGEKTGRIQRFGQRTGREPGPEQTDKRCKIFLANRK